MATDPEILTPEQVAELRRDIHEMDPMPKRETALVLTLCATVEAQAEVIQRYKDEWKPAGGTRWRGWWVDARLFGDRDREPMSEAEQLVVLGEVVAPRSTT